MTAIVRNRALDCLRQPSELEADDSHEELFASVLDEHPGPEELLLRSTDARRLAERLSRITNGQRRSITFAFFHGLSHTEVAAKFRRPLGTAKTRIRRGLERVREYLEAD